MPNTKDITLEQTRQYAFEQAKKLQVLLDSFSQPICWTDHLREAFELSLAIDILQDSAVIKDLHWELQRGKRNVSDNLGKELVHNLVYTQNDEETYISLYRRSMQ